MDRDDSDGRCLPVSVAWTGRVEGQARSGSGRGTKVLVRRDDGWRILHEHLSG